MLMRRVALGVVGLIAIGTAWAEIPAADGTITACYHAKSGKLRVVDGTPCRKKELPLTWSRAGVRIFAFVQTWQCCGMLLDPPQLRHASGITAAARDGAGEYVVTVDRDVTDCLATASIASDDAAFPQAGLIGVGRPSGIPANQFLVVMRDTTGALADVGSTGGTYGFSIAVFCPS